MASPTLYYSGSVFQMRALATGSTGTRYH